MIAEEIKNITLKEDTETKEAKELLTKKEKECATYYKLITIFGLITGIMGLLTFILLVSYTTAGIITLLVSFGCLITVVIINDKKETILSPYRLLLTIATQNDKIRHEERIRINERLKAIQENKNDQEIKNEIIETMNYYNISNPTKKEAKETLKKLQKPTIKNKG